MGMHSHVIGIRPPNDEYQKKVTAWKACVAANIDVPQELMDYFEGEGPREGGMQLNLEDHHCCEIFNEEMKDGFTIELEHVPEGVKFIRFYNAY